MRSVLSFSAPATGLLMCLFLLCIPTLTLGYPTPTGTTLTVERALNPRAPVPSKRLVARAPQPSNWKRLVARATQPSKWRRDAMLPRAPQPSGFRRHIDEKRSMAEQDAIASKLPGDVDFSMWLCPKALSACPVGAPGFLPSKPTSLMEWAGMGFECVDLSSDLGACGGCPGLDVKYDCSVIDGAQGVTCSAGTCQVTTCKSGLTLSPSKTMCTSA